MSMGCKDMGIRNSYFVTKTQFLHNPLCLRWARMHLVFYTGGGVAVLVVGTKKPFMNHIRHFFR